MAGSQSNVLPYLHAADLFVFPSVSESFGGSLAEAMACGLPCIALAAEGNIRNASDEMLGRGCGQIVAGKEPNRLADAIDELATDRDRRRAMGIRASRLALSRFTWTAGGQALQALVMRTGRRCETTVERGTEVSEVQSDALATRSG